MMVVMTVTVMMAIKNQQMVTMSARTSMSATLVLHNVKKIQHVQTMMVVMTAHVTKVLNLMLMEQSVNLPSYPNVRAT